MVMPFIQISVKVKDLECEGWWMIDLRELVPDISESSEEIGEGDAD